MKHIIILTALFYMSLGYAQEESETKNTSSTYVRLMVVGPFESHSFEEDTPATYSSGRLKGSHSLFVIPDLALGIKVSKKFALEFSVSQRSIDFDTYDEDVNGSLPVDIKYNSTQLGVGMRSFTEISWWEGYTYEAGFRLKYSTTKAKPKSSSVTASGSGFEFDGSLGLSKKINEKLSLSWGLHLAGSIVPQKLTAPGDYEAEYRYFSVGAYLGTAYFF